MSKHNPATAELAWPRFAAEKPNDLLSAIKRGANLRKVSDAPPAEPPQTKGRGGLLGNEVDKILNLRAKIAAASESSSSDSGSDWD